MYQQNHFISKNYFLTTNQSGNKGKSQKTNTLAVQLETHNEFILE